MCEYFPEPKSLGGRVKVELATSRSNVDKLDIDKFKNVPTNLNNLKSKVNKYDVNKPVPVPADLSKIKLKKKYIMLRLKTLNIKYLILLT